jgi:hypothetical protein
MADMSVFEAIRILASVRAFTDDNVTRNNQGEHDTKKKIISPRLNKSNILIYIVASYMA